MRALGAWLAFAAAAAGELRITRIIYAGRPHQPGWFAQSTAGAC